MARASILRVVTLALGAFPILVGCSTVAYKTEPVVSHSRYATIENFSTEVITPEQVDGLLAEVAQILAVQLDPAKPKARIVVTTPTRIANLYRATTGAAPFGADAEGLYFPGASLVLISYYDRTILGHELAHYPTDHYLPQTPRDKWEAVARMVERKLPTTPAVVATAPVPTLVAARASADLTAAE
jgi:hypothetical protein